MTTLEFRNLMAENGIERTPEEAARTQELVIQLIEYTSVNLSINPDFIFEMENENKEEKIERIKDLQENYGLCFDKKNYKYLKFLILKFAEEMEDGEWDQ